MSDPDNPRLWANVPKVALTPKSPMLRVGPVVGGHPPVAFVRRRGRPEYLLRYDTFETDTRGHLFFFDHLLFTQPPGRYAIEVWHGDTRNPMTCDIGRLCARFEVDLGGCELDPCAVEIVEPDNIIIRKGEIAVATPIFDVIRNFEVKTCGDTAAGDPNIPLSAADRAALCNMVLCRPVELRIHDGVRSELVRFMGCTSATPRFERNADGEGTRKFPKGATLTFNWTEANILAATEGC